MTSSHRAAVIAIALASGIAALRAGQDPQQTPPVFRGGIEIMQLDVSVLDKRRQPVRGLTAENFTVNENGKPQRIVAVSEVTLDGENVTVPVWARAAAPDVASNDVGDKRIFAIVIDGGGTVVPDILAGVIDRLVPGDVVAVIGGGCYVPFTEDLEKLHACLESLRRTGPRTRPPTLLPPTRPSDGPPHSILRDVTEYLAAVPQRRKAILYIGSGFNLGPGRSSSRGVSQRQQDYYETLWFAHNANVNIYTFGSNANVSVMQNGMRSSPSSALRDLAEETGGVMTEPRQLDAGLDQMFVENGSYYLIGYQTTHPEMDGKFRGLSVKVNRPDTIVRTRKGWYRPKLSATSDGTSAAAMPTKGLSDRLRDWMPSLDVAFDSVAMPFAQPGQLEAAVPIVIGLSEPVTAGVRRVVQKMDVRMLAYDDTGALVIDNTRRVNLDAAPTTENKVRYDVLQQVSLAPGRYAFRLVAHNADTDKVGSIEFDVSVPDFTRQSISLSGVAISAESGEKVTTVGSLGSTVPVTPTAMRKFITSDRVTAFARVYEGGTDPLSPATLEVKILDAKGVPVFSKTESLDADRFEGSRAVDYRFQLPLGTLKGGAYLLTMQAMRGARQTAPRDVRFIVR